LHASHRQELLETVDEIAGKIRRYLGVTVLTSMITGIASALWAYVVGLELALVWGILNFLLNFIPIIGNVIGIIPPNLYAVIQFQSLTMSLIVFLGFVALQIVISNFVYPTLQGCSLSLSPVAIFDGPRVLELGMGDCRSLHRGTAHGGAGHHLRAFSQHRMDRAPALGPEMRG
jgi:predicted PurR-regulated permease PerM